MNLLRAEKNIYLKGPFTALPEMVMSNQDVLNWMKSSQNPTLVSFSTGIRNRRWVNENQACSDLAVLAAEKLFAAKPAEKNKINQIILVIASALFADGEVSDTVCTPAGGSRLPAAHCTNPELFYITIKENTALFVKAVHDMVDGAEEFLKALKLSTTDIQWLVPHQGNKNLVLSVAKQLGFPEERIVKTVEETGNTSGSSVGIALDYLREHADIKAKDKVLLVAAGGGGIAACALLEVI